MDLLGKFANWILKKRLIKMQKVKIKDEVKELQEGKENLQRLYQFIKWLNESFTNRRMRKIFWREVESGKPLMEERCEMILKKYEEDIKKKEKKK